MHISCVWSDAFLIWPWKWKPEKTSHQQSDSKNANSFSHFFPLAYANTHENHHDELNRTLLVNRLMASIEKSSLGKNKRASEKWKSRDRFWWQHKKIYNLFMTPHFFPFDSHLFCVNGVYFSSVPSFFKVSRWNWHWISFDSIQYIYL